MPKASINPDLVRDLASLLDETGLTEIEYETGTFRVRVSRQSGVTVTAPAPAATTTAAAATPPSTGNGEAAPEAPAYDASHPGAISSPMVGTVYTAPEPGADDFVRVGERVSAGQTLLLIEAMKTFNEIRAPRAGTVISVLIGNEQPVEYGDVLMIVE
jgi:acetyl-CoA carboxylase biotin carboxyl carrier protein